MVADVSCSVVTWVTIVMNVWRKITELTGVMNRDRIWQHSSSGMFAEFIGIKLRRLVTYVTNKYFVLHCFVEIWFGLVFFTQVVTVGHCFSICGSRFQIWVAKLSESRNTCMYRLITDLHYFL